VPAITATTIIAPSITGMSISATTYYSGNNLLQNVLSQTGHTHAFSTITSTGHNHTMSNITDLGTIAAYSAWTGTQAQYDALGTYDINTLYFVSGTGAVGGVTAHSGLTGLLVNDHPQYSLSSHTHSYSAGTSGVTEHSGLTGLVNDDHPRYSQSSHTHSYSASTSLFESKSATLRSPTSGENVTLFYAYNNYTVISADTSVLGTTPSATWKLFSGSNRSSGTEFSSGVTTSTTTVQIFNIDRLIPADSFVWLTTTATGGTAVSELHLTMLYSGV
jgi:hypothetical protein